MTEPDVGVARGLTLRDAFRAEFEGSRSLYEDREDGCSTRRRRLGLKLGQKALSWSRSSKRRMQPASAFLVSYNELDRGGE